MLADVTHHQRQSSNAAGSAIGPGCPTTTTTSSSVPAAAQAVLSRPSSRGSTPAVSPMAVTLSVPAAALVDPTLVPEYHVEIIRHLMLREQQCGGSAIDPTYLTNQLEVTERMRSILVDWMVDVSLKFKLHPETFFLTVNIIDRYLSRHQALRARLQLIGITSCLIAAKHEQIWPPEVRDCVYIAANTYTAQEILEAERDIASVLHFRFTVPTPYPMLCFLLDNSDTQGYARDAAMFFLESATHDYKMLQFRPSRVACAALLLSNVLLEYNSAMAGSGVMFSQMGSAYDEDSSSLAGGAYGNASTTSGNNTTSYQPSGPLVVSAAQLAVQMWDYRYVQLSEGVTFEEVLPVAEMLLLFTTQLTAAASRLQALRRKYLQTKFGAVASLTFPASIVV